MSAETKTTSAAPEHPFPPVAPYPPHFTGGSYPPPSAFPPYYAYAQPPEGSNGDSNNPNAPPGPPQYMMAYPPPPPGMMYAFPTPTPQAFPTGFPQSPIPAALTRPKRRQVKMACTNCAAACKRCDEQRPCERCMKYGITDSCVDGQRKERRKGIKRGPYKRKSKTDSAEPTHGALESPKSIVGHDSHLASAGYSPTSAEPDWQQSAPPQAPPAAAAAAATTSAAIHAVAQYSHEGYYPLYYPPPFIPQGHESQPGPDGLPPGGSGQPPMYFVHPGAYPPYSHYPHPAPGAYPVQGGPPAAPAPAQEAPPPAKKPEESGEAGGDVPAAEPQSKKRSRASKGGEAKTKKARGSGRVQKALKVNGHEPEPEPEPEQEAITSDS